jgi:hypothetical protein
MIKMKNILVKQKQRHTNIASKASIAYLNMSQPWKINITKKLLISKLASGTWVAQTFLHLPQRKHDFTISLISPIPLLSRIKASCSTKRKEGKYPSQTKTKTHQYRL